MKKSNSITDVLKEYVQIVIVTLLISAVILHFVQISRVSGDSMKPSFHHGQIVFIDKRFYHLDDCHYNDVVVVTVDLGGEREQIIKRVIALPGDRLSCKHGVMYRNDEKLIENYIYEPMEDETWRITVGAGEIFVMGDNRNHSTDSRDLGTIVFKDAVVGRVVLKL